MFDYQPNWTEWFYVAAPLQVYGIIVVVLACYGDHGNEGNVLKIFFRRISDCLERWTGYAGWSMAGALSGLLMLATAAIGFYWDVAFHVDYGRDQQLFTPSHTMIVIGLGGLVYSAVIAILFASIDEADVPLRVGFVRLPYSALALGAFGMGGLAAFPLDALWHEAYGVDVTLWSPTHLQLVAGASLATVVVWLMIREGTLTRPIEPTLLGRGIQATVFGAVLVGLSTAQGEFDFGVPQFQVLYLPLLIAAAAGMGLVLARLALGRWGAIKTVLAFLIIRGVIGLLVAAPFNSTFPRFPLYLVAALAVEGVAYLVGTQNRLRFAVLAGAVAGTVGVAADLIWLNALSDVHATTAALPKAALLSPIAAIAAALLGAALARPVGDGGTRVPAVAALVGGLALVAVLAYPLPRNVGHVEADIRLRPVGTEMAVVEVDLHPADAAKSATAFGALSWQGGGTVAASLDEVAPGRYVSSKPLHITGRWKTVVGLQRGDQVMAVPVYMPADVQIGAPEIPALPERHEVFARNTKWLMRELKPGAAWVANAAYTGVAVVVLAWIGLYALCAMKLTPDEEAPRPMPTRPFAPPPAPSAAPERQPVATGLRGPNATDGLRGPNATDGLRGPNAGTPPVGASWGWGDRWSSD